MMSYLVIEVRDDTEREVVSVGPFPDEQKAQAVMDACQWGYVDSVRVSTEPEGGVISIGVAFRTVLLTKTGQPIKSEENFRYVSSLIQTSYGGFA